MKWKLAIGYYLQYKINIYNSYLPVNVSDILYLCNRRGEQRRQPCVASVTIILFEIIFDQTFTFLKTDLFVKDQKT